MTEFLFNFTLIFHKFVIYIFWGLGSVNAFRHGKQFFATFSIVAKVKEIMDNFRPTRHSYHSEIPKWAKFAILFSKVDGENGDKICTPFA
jgi:hypothetical protein